jgi:hypothetical protein
MSEYQPIYDAIRSRIGNCDIGFEIQEAIQQAMQQAHLAHYIDITASGISQEVQNLAAKYSKPSVIYRPILGRDGDKWCALYGNDLQTGVVGFGGTPQAAMEDFDKAWNELGC